MIKTHSGHGLRAETKRVGKFGIVGIINTTLDFGLFNLLIEVFGVYRILANLISTTIAMLFSFFANKTFVFKSSGQNPWHQLLIFFPVTAFGLYVIQNGIIFGLTEVWRGPLDLAYAIVEFLGLDALFARDFIFNNGAKAIATIASLSWNYVMYKLVVFKK